MRKTISIDFKVPGRKLFTWHPQPGNETTIFDADGSPICEVRYRIEDGRTAAMPEKPVSILTKHDKTK